MHESDDDHLGNRVPLAPGVTIDEDALRWSYARSAGPGGQNVNKVNTKAELRVAMSELQSLLRPEVMLRLRTLAGKRVTTEGELILVSQAERSQEANREDALAKLRELVVKAQDVPKPRKKSKPSRAAKRRRVEGKRRRSEVKRGRASQEFD